MAPENVLILVCVAGAILVGLALLLWLIAMGARPEYEDETGFHEGEKK